MSTVVVEEWGGDGDSDRVSHSLRAQIKAQLITALLGDAALVEDDVVDLPDQAIPGISGGSDSLIVVVVVR